MTEQETIKVITLIVMSYPSNDKFKDEDNIKGMVAVWKTIFKDDDVRVVEMAVQKHISINKWPPSIAEVREQMCSLLRPDIIPPDIAWAAVEDLLHAKGEYGHFDLYAVLPDAIARVVETIGWSTLWNLHCGRHRGNPDGMDRVAFMDLYKPAYEREREQAMLPKRLSEACERSRRELGGDNILKLERAKQARIEQDEFYEQLTRRNYEKLLEKGTERKLLGGSEDEEN